MTSAQILTTTDDGASFEAVIRSRRSIRRYCDDAVPRADVDHMVGLATSACSPRNAQMWRFVAIDDRSLSASMHEAVEGRFAELAKWAVVRRSTGQAASSPESCAVLREGTTVPRRAGAAVRLGDGRAP